MLSVRMNSDVLGAFGTQQMHRESNHHGALIEMVLVRPVSAADAVRRRRKRRHEVLKIQSALPFEATNPNRAAH